ncbi:hypothetical protein [Azospirillum sp. TSH64]|uniref:hypothetical protein n=1 Tax=Azospirillum sp. TSH64 TaxID=652740 RepID=UPI000D60F9AD|nr:hypothetical protein [Azospirillum sp. TSH64]PWC81248.1 hypothetical protein TSH64_00970 [Azospirillum sp. TSH64]
MPLNLANLQSAIQGRVDALGPSSDEKTLLLLSKAIEAAVGNVSVSEVVGAATSGVADLEAKRIAEVQAILDAAAAKIAQINALDAVLKTGGTMTGALNGTTMNATVMNAAVMTADAASPSFYWRESDAPLNGKTWEANAENQALTFRIWNEAMSAYTSFLRFVRNGVASIYVMFATAVRSNLTTVSAVSNTFTVDANLGNEFDLGTISAASTLANIANPPAAGAVQSIAIRWAQDAVGGRTLSFGGNCVNVGGTNPNTSANKVNFAVGKVYPDGKFYYAIVRGA